MIENAIMKKMMATIQEAFDGQEQLQEALAEQKRAFEEKFGREPTPDDPVFFDPDEDEPTEIGIEKLITVLKEACKEGGLNKDETQEMLAFFSE